MTPIAGWYDDPRDASRLRYWDGDAWTEHVAPKQQAPAAAQWSYPGAPPTQQQTWQYGTPTAAQLPGTRQGQGGPTTPDGVRITSWLRRLAARLLDGLFVFVLSLPLTGYFLYRYLQAVADQVNDTKSTSLMPGADVLRWELPLLLVLLGVQAVYETVCLRRWSATLGKRVMGISVRMLDGAGRLGWPVIARRVGFLYGVSLLSLVPVVSYVAAVVWLLDYIWPLWDKPRQALHDKVAGTVVVEGPRQPAALPQM